MTPFADVLVTGYEDLEPSLHLPDPDDRHVLAAAIRCGAQSIITFNRKDFPGEALEAWNIEVLSPDELVLDLLDLVPGRIVQALSNMHSSLGAPPFSLDDLLDILSRDGLVRSAEVLREHF